MDTSEEITIYNSFQPYDRGDRRWRRILDNARTASSPGNFRLIVMARTLESNIKKEGPLIKGRHERILRHHPEKVELYADILPATGVQRHG